jgi:heme-degrading monooxygenase HmoA
MFVLFVDIKLKPGSADALKKTYKEVFRPAITSQDGFHSVALLRSNKDSGEYSLSIAFMEHELQKKWVASDLHQDVWPRMETHFAEYSVRDYTAI